MARWFCTCLLCDIMLTNSRVCWVCRERVRAVYEAGGVGGDVPTDMPRPLRVGQSVVARHPATRTAADGIVLTIKPSKYRVQFNRCAV